MFNSIKYIIMANLFSFLFSSAIIKGIVSDNNTDAPLIGANIIVEDTELGSASDINGAYLISGIRACSTCTYNIKILYIGYEEFTTSILINQNKEYILDLPINPSSLEVETTTVTAKKRQDKITDAPAAIELVSASDIKREESTNLGSYLKGLKGVDFTSSGVNNYSISVRGFNSSFTSRLLTLTDGRVANIPALRVINYSTVPQSPKDIESIEVVLGPSTALYGANAHSGVVNITSKSPAVSEGLDISISGSAADERDLYKFSSRWAHKLSENLSFKLSGEYIQAYEWEFISEEEYKRHKYAWSGNPSRLIDGKDNNPWGFTTHFWEDKGIRQTIYHNYTDADGDGLPDESGYDTFLSNEIDCRIGGNYICEEKWRYVGDGEQNDTGDPDGDGFMGEDWFNGYDDDLDGLIDEDYFFADGIDNDGDCPGDTNGDGVVCGPGDDNVDEEIDKSSDEWIDGYDNNGNGEVDETGEQYGNNPDKYNLPDWQYDLEYRDIIIADGRKDENHIDKYGNTTRNPWYIGPENEGDIYDHNLRGSHIYDEENVELLFDVYLYDYGDDGLPGDKFEEGFGDEYGDQNFIPDEGSNLGLFNFWIDSNNDGFDDDNFYSETPIPSESFSERIYDSEIYGPNNFPDGIWGNGVGPNGVWEGGKIYDTNGNLISEPNDDTESFYLINDCGLDGLCNGDVGYPGPDFGEGNGSWDNFDWNQDGLLTSGDYWIDNGDGIFNFNLCDENGICGSDIINDTFPGPNGIVDPWEIHRDCGQDGLCFGDPGYPGPDYGENDGSSILIDNGELNNVFDIGDGIYGADAEPFIDNNNNGYYDCEDGNCDSFTDVNGDGVWTPADYKDNFMDVYDINGDGFDDYPDFEVKNSRTEFRLDYDPTNDLNITFQTGYSLSKLQQVAGIGRYLADNYEYTYYQLRGRYKNWFSQIYFNQGNSGQTRGYLLGDMIRDESRNFAFQLQNNFNYGSTKFVWGMDYFRTEALTNGSILNDGPNGYDNDGDIWFTSKDNIDTDGDSDDFSDWGNDGIGPYLTSCGDDGLCEGDDGWTTPDQGEGELILDYTNDWEEIVNCAHNDALYNAEFDFCYVDTDSDGQWTNDNDLWPYLPNPNYTGPDSGEGNGIPDPGEPGVNENGNVIVDQLDNDGDGLDFDGDGFPNFQEIQLNTNPYDPNDYPTAVPIESFSLGYDELIDEDWCGNIQYKPYVPDSQYSGNRDGKYWRCSEGIDEPDEYSNIISNEMGFYFQTKTIPKRNKKIEIITAARFDNHDKLDEGIQFAPKFGLFYKPTNFQTFRITYGKAYNTPSALTMATDLFIGKRGLIDYYLRGNTEGTNYLRVGDDVSTAVPQIFIPEGSNSSGASGFFDIINLASGNSDVSYWDGYEERVQGAPYFLGFNTEFSDVPEFMPLDTQLYTVWVPELADSGRIYTAEESRNISNISPIKTEKIQTLEIGFKGFLSERIHATVDFYTSFYEDFFSAPTIITPLIIRRQFNEFGDDITSFDNIEVVGMLPATYDGGNYPFATQWDGLDNDYDWDCEFGQTNPTPNCFLSRVTDPNGMPLGYLEDYNDTTPEYGNLKDLFGWDGVETVITDEDGSIISRQCTGCEGEWGYVEFITDSLTLGSETVTDTIGFTIHQPWEVINVNQVVESGAILFNSDASKDYIPVGIDEYSPFNGLSEAEMILSPIIDANGNNIVAPGFAYTPLHSVLAPMNYGEIWMSGLDLGLTYLIPESNIALDANFSFYNTTEYYNVLTRKNDPINAPKFKMNASVSWDSPFGLLSLKYRHVDQFQWKDGIWAGIIGPYDLFDIHYNYKISKHVEFNITGLNIFDDRHKEMIGGATMGRQIILRMSTAL